MSILVFFGVIFAVVLYTMVRGALDERKRRELYRRGLGESFGSFRDYRHSGEELKRISRLYERKKAGDGYFVDDITWNDLNMDGIFGMMDYAQSSAGEEYLYLMLRKPLLSDNSGYFDDLEKYVEFMMANEDKRLDTMMILNELGKSGKYSVYDYMDLLSGVGRRSNLRHFACILLLAVAVASIFINTTVGVVFVIAVACINITSYLKDKGSLAPYVSTFSYIMRMMRCRDELLSVDFGSSMDGFVGKLRDNRDRFKGFEKNSGMVLNMNSSVGSLWGIFFEYIKMLTHIDIIKFNNMLKKVQDNEHDIFELSEAIGFIDAVICIGYFRAALDYYCVPGISNDRNSVFSIKDGFHPAITKFVSNSFGQDRGMIITGSNAAGKSTFLKMTAINAILAQTIHTCAAHEYRGGFYRIYSSMALRDSLDDGESYYIVEIKALKRIVDEASRDCDNRVLCFVDEVLRGTNTVERIAASSQILEKLADNGVLCFAATHDIELTYLLESRYDNKHFEEDVRDGDIMFSYHLIDGRSQTRNAIKLLEVIGFSGDVIGKAEDMAKKFLDKGEWSID